jgi:hypothetical protein
VASEFGLVYVQGFGVRLELSLLVHDFIRSHDGGSFVRRGFRAARISVEVDELQLATRTRVVV